jgi:prevent-host-death family protein
MKTFTVEEFQQDFDNLIERVEQGESFIITSECGDAVMIPYKDVKGIINVDDELIRIHTDHEEGS